MNAFKQMGWGRGAPEVGIDPIATLPGIEEVQSALEALGIAAAAVAPILGVAPGSPQVLGVVGSFGQLYFDPPPNSNWYACNAVGGGATWTFIV